MNMKNILCALMFGALVAGAGEKALAQDDLEAGRSIVDSIDEAHAEDEAREKPFARQQYLDSHYPTPEAYEVIAPPSQEEIFEGRLEEIEKREGI